MGVTKLAAPEEDATGRGGPGKIFTWACPTNRYPALERESVHLDSEAIV
jgi:hypothetical protein